jgi:nitroreductase
MSAMDLYEAMRTTRAVRRLRPDPIPDDVIQRVIEAATWAPTGGNAQPWRVIVVRDQATKRRLQELYVGPWEKYAAGHRQLLGRLPEEARAKQERMLARRTILHAVCTSHPSFLVFCFNPALMAITDANSSGPRSSAAHRSTPPFKTRCSLAARKGSAARSPRCCVCARPR